MAIYYCKLRGFLFLCNYFVQNIKFHLTVVATVLNPQKIKRSSPRNFFFNYCKMGKKKKILPSISSLLSPNSVRLTLAQLRLEVNVGQFRVSKLIFDTLIITVLCVFNDQTIQGLHN